FFSQGDGLAAAGGDGRHLGASKFSRLAKNPDGSPRIEKPKAPTGLEGVSPAAIPPVGARELVRPAVRGPATPTITDREAPLWRGGPHVGRTVPDTTAAGPGGRIGFDWRQAQLRHDRGDWKLMVGGQQLANLGPNVNDARLLQSAVRYYRLTEQHL